MMPSTIPSSIVVVTLSQKLMIAKAFLLENTHVVMLSGCGMGRPRSLIVWQTGTFAACRIQGHDDTLGLEWLDPRAERWP